MSTDTPLEPLPPDVASVLAEDAAMPSIPPDVRARLVARVGATLGVPLVRALPPAVAPRSWLRTLLGSRATVGVAALTVGIGLGAVLHAQTSVRPRVMAHPTTVIVAPLRIEVGVPPSAVSPMAAPIAVAPTPVTAPVRASPLPANTLAAEQRAIDTAHTALSRGQADAALDVLQRHARMYPHGQLAEERESMLVQALVAAGRTDAAREQGARFRQHYPGSILEPVVDQALRSIP